MSTKGCSVPVPEEKDIILSTGFSSIEMSAQIARDLLALGQDRVLSSLSQKTSRMSNRTSVYLSDIEAAILRSAVPIVINETEEITALGHTGIWANKSEITNWKGDKAISEYPLNEDNEPEVITKRGATELEYVQELAIRYLRPPTPPIPGDIIITQEANTLTAPAPPLVIRQQPPRPDTPEPVVIREAPPQPPLAIGRKLITISGKQLPPPPRKVVIERLAPIPSKPQSVVIERWLPYNDSIKRRVIFRPPPPDPVLVKPRNVIVQWEAPTVNIRQEVKYLGIVRANPAEYVEKYGESLKASCDLPNIVTQIQTPEGIVLACEHTPKRVHELEGDLEGLRLVDLDREGLSEYKTQLKALGVKYLGSKSSLISQSSAKISAQNDSLPTRASSSSAIVTTTTELLSSASSVTSRLSSTAAQTQQEATADALSIIDNVFNQIDTNNDGNIEVREAERIFLRLNSRLHRSYGEDEVRFFFQKLDTNMDGYIDLSEFRTAMLALI